MAIRFNDAYLGKTLHKSPRGGAKPEMVIWHETAGNARSSLAWMLDPKSKVSWDFLIARDGTIYRCLDSHQHYGWHAGTARARSRDNVNKYSIGVEVEGPNDGTAITSAQRDSIIALMLYFRDDFALPLAREYHLGHDEVALPKGRKDDPRGYKVGVALGLAQEAATIEQPAPVIDLSQLTQELANAAEFYRQASEQLGRALARVALAQKKGDRS